MKISFHKALFTATISFIAFGLIPTGYAQNVPPVAASAPAPVSTPASTAPKKYAGKKVLYINSYNKGYPWSDGIEKGVRSVIEPSGAELRVEYMDTKFHQDDDFQRKAGIAAKAVIDEWKPDIVITSDDNAAKWVIVPFFKGSKIPFIFNGINWDAEQYGFPWPNVTGMLEVDNPDQMLEMLEKLKGIDPKTARVAVLAPNTDSEHQEIKNLKKVFPGINYVDERYASTFDEWKKDFIEMQKNADILQFQNYYSIKGWNTDEAEAFVKENIKIPTGADNGDRTVSKWAILDYAKVPEEQGEWAAQRALEVLDGRKISDIAITKNVRGNLYVNIPLAHKLGITFPPEILNAAQ